MSARYIPTGQGTPGTLPPGVLTDADLTGEQRIILMHAVANEMYTVEVIEDAEPTPVDVESLTPAPEADDSGLIHFAYVGGNTFRPGLPARDITSLELTGEQRTLMWQAVAEGLYAPNIGKPMTEDEREQVMTAARERREALAAELAAQVEALAAEQAAQARAETEAQAKREAAELAERERQALEGAKAVATLATPGDDDVVSPPAETGDTSSPAVTDQAPASVAESLNDVTAPALPVIERSQEDEAVTPPAVSEPKKARKSGGAK